MFERFADAMTVVKVAGSGDLAKLRKFAESGCSLDRRTTYDPWMNPMDAAIRSKNVSAVQLLLDSQVPVWGSSIWEAIKIDAAPILQLFHSHEEKFYRKFGVDKGARTNPRLHRWTLCFTALDFSLAIGATNSSELLARIGVPQSVSKRCHCGHHAPRIRDERFAITRGVNVDGQTEMVEGYYCVHCDSFT